MNEDRDYKQKKVMELGIEKRLKEKKEKELRLAKAQEILDRSITMEDVDKQDKIALGKYGLLDKRIEELLSGIIERFPEIAMLYTREQITEYLKLKDCDKCQYLQKESMFEEININDYVLKFCFGKNDFYCVQNISTTRDTYMKIESPKRSLCSNYVLNAKISRYVEVLFKKFQMKRQNTLERENKLKKIKDTHDRSEKEYNTEMAKIQKLTTQQQPEKTLKDNIVKLEDNIRAKIKPKPKKDNNSKIDLIHVK